MAPVVRKPAVQALGDRALALSGRTSADEGGTAMTTRGGVAKRVRLDKEAHPENYCTNANCLWRTKSHDGFKPCPKHPRTDKPCKS